MKCRYIYFTKIATLSNFLNGFFTLKHNLPCNMPMFIFDLFKSEINFEAFVT